MVGDVLNASVEEFQIFSSFSVVPENIVLLYMYLLGATETGVTCINAVRIG